jgi:vancomycin resistance protein YoaR
MSTMKSFLSNLQTIPGIPLEKDKPYRSEISDQQKLIKKPKAELSAEDSKITRLYGLNAESRGVEPAYIDSTDLIKIIEDLLTNKSPVSKAFKWHEVIEGMCADWAKRTIKYSLDKLALNSALDALAKNTDLILMKKYKVLDEKDIERSASYSAALTKLKKQLGSARTLQDKDDQLISKDGVIAKKDAVIEKLKEELVRKNSKDWMQRAIELKKAAGSVSLIANQLGRSRSGMSTYLNLSQVKSQWG